MSHRQKQKLRQKRKLLLEHPFECGPLTSEQKLKKIEVKEAYADFWNHVKFKKGWQKPLFDYEDVETLLDKAAEIVVRIRTHIDEAVPGVKLRMTDGSAREFLWMQVTPPIINEHEKRNFVHGVVHATLRDAKGYVEGLTKSLVDQYIDKIEEYLQKEELENLEKVKSLETEAKSYISETDNLLCQLADLPDEYKMNGEHLQTLERAIKSLNSLNEQLRGFYSKRHHCLLKNENFQKEQKNFVDEPVESTMPSENKSFIGDDESISSSIEDTSSDSELEKGDEQQSSSSSSSMMDVEEQEKKEKKKGVLEIKRVADDVDMLRSEIQHFRDNASSLDVNGLVTNPDEGEKTVEKLQKKCLFYSENLMKDLLSLDTLVGLSPEDRPLKKQQVTSIQALLDDVDALNEKLKNLRSQLQQAKNLQKQKQEEQEQERKKEEKTLSSSINDEEQNKDFEQENEQENENEDEDEGMEANWRAMKLKPKFEIKQQPNAIILQSYIPGMQEDSINISLGGGTSYNKSHTLTIQGYRGPSPTEEKAMRQQLRERLHLRRSFDDTSDEEEDTLLLKMGAGRYGSFSQTYELPPNADVNRISASYKNGILAITIPTINNLAPPKRGRVPPPSPYETFGFPFGGRASPIRSRQGGFFNDNDLWW